MLWVAGRRWAMVDGKRRWLISEPFRDRVYRGPRATDKVGPGSGGGTKVRILRQDTLEETTCMRVTLSQARQVRD